MVTSSWRPRTYNSPLHCLKFRYLVYGPDAHHLDIFHKYRGEDRESWIWTASQDDTDIWRYGQVPVGALGEFQVNRSKRDREQSFSNGHWHILKTTRRQIETWYASLWRRIYGQSRCLGRLMFTEWKVVKCYLDEVNLETCWPAVYLVGRPTHSQGSLVDHVLARPALLPSPINVDSSNLIGRFALPCPAGFAYNQTSAYNRGQNCWDYQPNCRAAFLSFVCIRPCLAVACFAFFLLPHIFLFCSLLHARSARGRCFLPGFIFCLARHVPPVC